MKVIVPSDRYDLIITRLATIDATIPLMVWQLHRFLAFRCEREFLARYIAKYPEFVLGLTVGSYVYACSDVDVLVRLHEFNLLPDTKRVAVAAAIRELAVETPDAGFLREGVRELLKPNEIAAILEDIRTKLLPDIDSTIRNWRGNYDENRNEDPEDHFDELVSALKEFRDELGEHPDAAAQIESALADIKEVVEELRSDKPQEPDSDDFRGQTSGEAGEDGSRSVFDDVDQ